MSFRKTLESVKKVFPEKNSPLTVMHRKQSRNKTLIAIEIAKFVISNLRFDIVGPTYSEIARAFDINPKGIRSAFFLKKPLDTVFSYTTRRGIRPQTTPEALKYLINIMPAVNTLTWSPDDIDKVFGPQGLINSFYLTPGEAIKALENYGKQKHHLRP